MGCLNCGHRLEDHADFGCEAMGCDCDAFRDPDEYHVGDPAEAEPAALSGRGWSMEFTR